MKIHDLFGIEGKVAVISGGSRGIGEMIAAGFLANGVKVYITARKERQLHLKAEELNDKYEGECISIASDLSTNEGIKVFADEIKEREKHIDFLINNAGAAWAEPFGSFSEGGWDKVMNLNVKSIFFLTQELAPLLKVNASSEDPSRVVNIGSIDGMNVAAFETYSYGASKAAVHHLTRQLARRLINENILVNGIAPGTVLPPPDHSEMDYISSVKHSLLKRIGFAEDIVQAVEYLLQSDFVTGTILPVDGGRSIYWSNFLI